MGVQTARPDGVQELATRLSTTLNWYESYIDLRAKELNQSFQLSKGPLEPINVKLVLT
jgi:hypothetical protein